MQERDRRKGIKRKENKNRLSTNFGLKVAPILIVVWWLKLW